MKQIWNQQCKKKKRLAKNVQSQQKNKERIKNENILRKLWDNMKHNNIHVMKGPEQGKREKKIEK